MLDLSHGISPLIKACLLNMLRDEHRTKSALKTEKAKQVLSNQFEKQSCYFNQLLRDVECHSERCGLHVDFAKHNSSDTLNVFFNETGFIGMLEAKPYDKIDLVSPFIGAIADRFCGICERLTALSFVRLVELL